MKKKLLYGKSLVLPLDHSWRIMQKFSIVLKNIIQLLDNYLEVIVQQHQQFDQVSIYVSLKYYFFIIYLNIFKFKY